MLHDVLAVVFFGEDQRFLGWFFCHSNCGYFVNQFAKPFALNSVFLWKMTSVYRKILFCQNIILPKYYFVNNFTKILFVKIVFYHNIMLPKYYFAKVLFCQNMMIPNIYRIFPGEGIYIN